MKKKILIFIGVVAVLALGAFIVLKIMTKNAERHVASEKGIPVTAEKLSIAFNASEDSANKTYLNKTIELSGVVTNIDSNENHQSILLFKNNPELPGVACTFSKIITGVNVGDAVVCKGICTGFLSNVTLSECVLTSTEKVARMVDTNHLTNPVKNILKDSNKFKKLLDTTTTTAISSKTFSTTKAQIKFDAGGGVEDIKAVNNQGDASISSAGVIKFKVPILGFKFPDALMQQHFNEEYMESSKFPTASFSGNISNIQDIDFNKDGTYNAAVSGNLTIHGVTQKVTTKASLVIKGGRLAAQNSIDVKLADYKISTDATSSAVLTISCNF